MKIFYYLYIDFLRFIRALFTKGYLKATPEVALKRFKICEGCPLVNREGLLVKLMGLRCGVCGCALNYKTGLNFEICPDKPPRWMDAGRFPEEK